MIQQGSHSGWFEEGQIGAEDFHGFDFVASQPHSYLKGTVCQDDLATCEVNFDPYLVAHRRVGQEKVTAGERRGSRQRRRDYPAQRGRRANGADRRPGLARVEHWQITAWITGHPGFSVSEATAYRILSREGLVSRLGKGRPAGKEHTNKTTAPHQLWATHISYFRVVGWGYYYLVRLRRMDDSSRFILAWRLQVNMTSTSPIEVVQDAVDITGMTDVPVEDRTQLLSDNGSGYISRSFREYLNLVGIRHILAAPFHRQRCPELVEGTNGKLERCHQTLKRNVNQVPYDVPKDLEIAIGDFVTYYNFRRYHKALRDPPQADRQTRLLARQGEILLRRKEVKARTVARRRRLNKTLREQLVTA